MAGRAASTWVGAALSLALMAGMAVWFYRLGTRDASQIPVIRAAEGPAKERPEDPGGDEAPHQSIRSYEVVEDGAVPGTAPEPRPELAPDPPAPEPEDGPMETAPPRARPDAPALAEAPAAGPLPEPEATVAALDAEPGALTDAAPEPLAAPEPEAPEAEEVVPVSDGPAPAISPRARPRPPGLVERATAAAAEAAATPDTSAETLAAAAAASRIQVQLGAYETPDMTREMWQRIRGSHGDVLAGRALSVQTTVSGGKTWYRLRVGPFRDGSEARNVCAALQARGQDCIVARNG